MTLANTLEPVYREYEITRDCFKVTLRAVRENNTGILEDTGIIYEPDSTIEECRDTMDDLTVVALWAFFERRVIEFVQTKGSTSIIKQAGPQPFANLLSASIEKHIERKSDMLNLFKDNIDKKLLDGANEIKRLRDWIVHRSLPPSRAKLILKQHMVFYLQF